MLNPLITVLSGQVNHPFASGKKTAGVTIKHRPLIWECMLGTVYAMDWTTKDINAKGEYFDYDYTKAHHHAKVAQCTDLRVCRVKKPVQGGPSYGKLALFGIPPAKE